MSKKPKKQALTHPKPDNSTNKKDHSNQVIAWATVSGVCISIGGLYLLNLQYQSTMEQSRARPSITQARLSAPLRAGSKPPVAIFHVKNFGGVAATNISQQTISIYKTGLPKGPMPQDLGDLAGGRQNAPVFQSTNHLEPGQEDTLFTVNQQSVPPLTDALYELLSSGRAFFYVIARITYRSRGEPHYVEYCGVAVQPIATSTGLVNCDQWNDAR